MAMPTEPDKIRPAQLRMLREVAQRRSYAAAARALGGITATGVSKAIAQLEKHLGGVKLLREELYGVTPTPEGLEVLKHTDRVLSDLKELAVAVTGKRAEKPARVRVACLEVHVEYLLAEAKKNFEELPESQAAGWEVDLVIVDNSEGAGAPILHRLVRDGGADLAVGGQEAPDLNSHPLYEASLVAVTWPKGYGYGADKVSLGDLAKQPVAIPRPGFFSRQVLDTESSKEGVTLKIAVEARSTGVLLRFGKLGLAVPVVSEDWLPLPFHSPPRRSDPQLVQVTAGPDDNRLVTKVHLHCPVTTPRPSVAKFIEKTYELAGVLPGATSVRAS
jgi:DNA-binding transcriptional LysR family regulator